MQRVKTTGKTVEEAVQKALLELGITEDAAEIHVVEEAKPGIFGFGKKDAVVEVSVKETETPAEPIETVSAPAESAEPENISVEPEEAPAAPAESSEVSEVETADVPEEKAESANETEAADETPAKRREEREFSQEEQNETAEEAKKFLEGIFRSIGLHVTMEKMMSRDRILLNLHGDGLGILIGKHGHTLNSLQYLTNLAAGKLYHHRYFVLLDVENYRIRREQTLTTLALRLAEKAKRTGAPIELEPMDPGERRMIHLALQEDEAVTTESEGEGSFRHVVILPKK